ncbi:MAG TPA: SDR family oxidoreductase [Methylomirabilota bacterium]|nr:SDR family oxidoreductase [Methylomirabilota bacterium]
MTTPGRFEGKVVAVTGAAKGFGEAIARRFAAEGARVVLGDVDEAAGTAVARSIETAGGRARFRPCDVAAAADVEALVGAAVEGEGGLDVMVNNAGFSHTSMPLWDLPEADFDRQIAVNFKGVFLGCKYAVPALRNRGGGVIVNTASIGARRPRRGVTVYNATKGAVLTLTRGLAGEVARDGIRVCAVCPVAADTAFMVTARGGTPLDDRTRESLVRGIPLGRLCAPDDVAGAVTFLASPDAAFLTGVCLDVDGGRSIE